MRFEALGDDPLEWFDEAPKRRQIDPVRVGPAFFAVFRHQVDKQFDALVPLADDVDAVIGQGLMYGAPSAAERHGVPYHYLCPNPFLLRSAWHPPIGVPFAHHLPRLANRLAWSQFALFYQLGFRRLINRQRRRIGWARLGEGFDGADDVLVVGPVDHTALLPRVAAAVHHGGVGTASAAARAGIPQVVVPHACDQHTSGASLVRAGVASASIPRRRLDADRLAAAISAARRDSTVERAAGVGSSIRRRDPLVTVCERARSRRSRQPSSSVARSSSSPAPSPTGVRTSRTTSRRAPSDGSCSP